MNRIGMVVLIATLGGAGCALNKEMERPPQVRLKSAAPAVTPDEVNESNAVEKMRQLSEEVESELKGRVTGDSP